MLGGDDDGIPEGLLTGAVELMLLAKNIPTADTAEIGRFYAPPPPPPSKDEDEDEDEGKKQKGKEKKQKKQKQKKKKKKMPTILSVTAHRRAVQDAWCAVLRHRLPPALCKAVLLAAERRIVPAFLEPQLLMDFLLACYDGDGSSTATSLLALNGLFSLMTTKNLDCPHFFPKLYALLDARLLHLRHRSRFLRLLDVFLASTHLPAALVASFVKRLARLCLAAPPAAVVAVGPLVYNLFRRHRQATYMMHRVAGDAAEAQDWARCGFADPFDAREPDPLRSRAIDSCVWELETLMGHWHPSVATLSHILREQFTKEHYLLEDFLDHSYASVRLAPLAPRSPRPPRADRGTDV